MADSSEFQPLTGVRIVDLSTVLAGPYATYQLALLGAEVIKIESPDLGDWARRGGADTELDNASMGLAFLTQNANKQSITLDLKQREALEIAGKLIERADVFVENFRPGTAARLKLDVDSVRALNPDIVYCSISAYGQDGPISNRPAYDHVVQGMSGIMSTTGTLESGPTKVGAPYVDYATGLNAAFSILSALYESKTTGRGVTIDVAMLDTSMMLMSSLVTSHLSSGWTPEPSGNAAWSNSPSSGAFETPDGMLMIAANTEAQFQHLCQALGRDDILLDERWAQPEVRMIHSEALRNVIAAELQSNTALVWESIFEQWNVPASRVRTLPEVVAEPQFAQRGQWPEMDLESPTRTVRLPAVGFKVDGQVIGPTHAPPQLGQDTNAVLESLGYGLEEISTLRDRGVV